MAQTEYRSCKGSFTKPTKADLKASGRASEIKSYSKWQKQVDAVCGQTPKP